MAKRHFCLHLQDNDCRNDRDCSEGGHGGATGVRAEGLGRAILRFIVWPRFFDYDARGDVLVVDFPVAVPVYESHSCLLSPVKLYSRLLSRLYNRRNIQAMKGD